MVTNYITLFIVLLLSVEGTTPSDLVSTSGILGGVSDGKIAKTDRTFGGVHRWGYPNSWMVFIRENPANMDDDWGYLCFGKPPFGHLEIVGKAY